MIDCTQIILIVIAIIIIFIIIIFLCTDLDLNLLEIILSDDSILIDKFDKIEYDDTLPTNRLRITSLSPFRLYRRYNTLDFDKINKTNTPLIIIKPSMLKTFVDYYLPLLKTKAILIFTDSMYFSSCNTVYNYRDFMSNPNIKHTFAENWWNKKGSPFDINKLTYLPIGPEGKISLSGKEKDLVELSKSTEQSVNKPLKVLSNAHLSQYRRPASGHYNQRNEYHNVLKNNTLVDFWSKGKPNGETWKEHRKYAFEISPTGNGLDCHRFYEAILLNTIPIVKDGPLTPLYKQFGCVIVKDWNEITLENLQKWKYNVLDKQLVTFGYWKNKILGKQLAI